MELVHFSIETRGVTWGFPILRPDRPPCASLATLSCLKLRGLEWWSRVAPCLGPKLGKKKGQMTHFHPFPLVLATQNHLEQPCEVVYENWLVPLVPMGSHGFPWVPMDHPREIAESPMNQIGKCGGFTGHRFLTPTQLGHDLEMRDTAIINHHFVGVSQFFNIFHHHTDLDTPCVFIHAIAFCLDIRRCPKMGVPQVTMDLNTKMNLKKNKWPTLE